MNNYENREENSFGRNDNNTSSKYGSTNSGFDSGFSSRQQQQNSGVDGFGSSANFNDRNDNDRNRRENCKRFKLTKNLTCNK